MTPAIASLAALLIAIVASMTTRINVGLLAMVLAWVVGAGVAGLSPDKIAAGFPGGLFVTLTGVTLLFAIAEQNGTLARYTGVVLRSARGDARLLPIIFFVLAAAVSTVGPGAIAAVALLAPVAMPVAERAGVSPLLMALMVGNGANAGNLSPVSAVGLIANSRMAEAGIVGHEWRVWAANGVVHVIVAVAAYALFGGWRAPRGDAVAVHASTAQIDARVRRRQRVTAAAIVAWVLAVVALRWPPGLSAVAVATMLLLLRVEDEQVALRAVPWGVIVMVCGVTVLVSLLEATGGMTLFTQLLAALATPESANGVLAAVTGAISLYSSTSGVVLPAFLPTVPGLVSQLGGGDPVALSLSINVGSSLVDVSPLSTLGALCIAAAPASVNARVLFRQLLAWGLSMTLVAGALCYLFMPWFAAR